MLATSRLENLDMDPMVELLGWYSSLRFDDLPPAAIAAARDLIIDAVGCGLSGSSAPLNAELIERYGRWGGTPEATVFGARSRLPAPAAAWLNAAMIHADDFDDTHDDTSIHLAVTIVPAVFAAAEATGRLIPGREVITAVVGAAEIAVRLGYAVRGHLHSGWLPTTLFGAIAAAAGAAKVMGLGRTQLLDAVGLGYAQMHGNRQSLLEATLTKRIQPAFSARAGVESAVLAEVGIDGPQRIVEGASGLFALFAGGQGNAAALTDGLGERYEMSRTSVKPYPCCRSNHGVIGAADDARQELDEFNPDEIALVDVWISAYSFSMVGQPFQLRENPQVDAQFSAQWTGAHTLLHGPPGLRHFEPDRVIAASDVHALARRVRVHVWEATERGDASRVPVRSTRVAVRLANGRSADVTHAHPKGSPEWPLPPTERRDKFLACAANAAVSLDQSRIEAALTQLEALDQQGDLTPILQLLTPRAAI